KATPARTARIGRAATASPMNASTNRTRGFLPPGCRGYPITSELAANQTFEELGVYPKKPWPRQTSYHRIT
ncbi:MAG TPA: hypothetical protein VK638_06270, partial [Edaphobacter sp.]|nr:hypothetical protein [Edaphobacter sp.]